MMHKQDVVVQGKKISRGQIWIHQSKIYGPEIFIVQEVFNPDNIRMYGSVLPFNMVDFLNMRMVEHVDKESAMVQTFIHRELIEHGLEEPVPKLSKALAVLIVIILTALLLYFI